MLDLLADPTILAALLFGCVAIAAIGLVMAYRFSSKDKNFEEGVVKSEWQPTGKIDFYCREMPKGEKAEAAFILRMEDFRTVESISGVEHMEIRWRNANLAEAKSVVVAHQSATGSKGYSFHKQVEASNDKASKVGDAGKDSADQ